MLVDHHTHHYRCGHAEGTLTDVIEAAIRKGFAAIGLSDHGPICHLGDFDHPEPRRAMARSEFPAYVREMERLRKEYEGRIEVKLAVESDHVDGWEEHFRAMWSAYDLDYVIGSVHWLGNWNIFSRSLPEGKRVEEVYEAYLLSTQAAARSGVYDVLGHIDCIKTAGHLPTRAITPLLEETIRVIAQSGVAIELNTSGWRKEVDECYPRLEVLECCRHYGVPVALGSDAHRPADVGAAFDRACRLLLEAGYTELVTFSRRRRIIYPIDLDRVAHLRAG